VSKKGVLYVRVSSKEQQEEGYSVDAQVENGREYARRQGIEIARTWTIAESAKASDREGFAELVAFVRSRPDVRAMIFEKADRMTRNYADLVRIYDLIEKHDKEAHFFKENFFIGKDSRSSEKLRLDIQVVLARNYVNNLAEEVTKGMLQKVKQGGFPAKAPTGYVNDIATREIHVDPSKAPIIRKLYELYATGRYSITDLVAIGVKAGLEHPLVRKPIGLGGVHRILTNPFYYGLVRWRNETVLGKHEPLVSKALFDRVQEVMGDIKRPHTKKVAFVGFALCGHCGGPITAETHLKKQKNGVQRTYVYYRCTGWRSAGKVCKGSHISERDLIAQLGEPLKGLKMDHPTLLEVKKALKESRAGEDHYHRDRVTVLQREETRLNTWLSKAYADRLDEVLTVEEYRQKTAAWRARAIEIQNEIGAHKTASSNHLDDAMRILELAQRAHDLYQRQQNNHERRKLIDSYVSKVVISDRRAVLNLREPFLTLSKLAIAASSGVATKRWYARQELNLFRTIASTRVKMHRRATLVPQRVAKGLIRRPSTSASKTRPASMKQSKGSPTETPISNAFSLSGHGSRPVIAQPSWRLQSL
jgi:DNA invertase Pin-like site-specific DNA recombinase